MTVIFDKILKLTKQLYPKGRAYKIPEGGWFYRLHKGLALSEERVYNEALGVLDSILPDNDNFTTQDATDWERRLGLINGTGVSLEDRKAAIRRKMNHPGNVKPRENWMFLESQLQLAGFNVYVYENRFPDYPDGYYTQSPIDLGLPSTVLSTYEHGEREHGEIEMGYYYNNVLANHIDETLDSGFDIGDNFRSTFFIAGSSISTIADVPLARKNEFRQTILKLKPVQTAAFLFINYTA